jgi:hypothetical protein
MTPTGAGRGFPLMGFKACEFRSRRNEEWCCEAAGGLPLPALRRSDEPPEAVCARCTVPEKLARRPCLFMMPVRVRRGDAIHDLFGCHWYHSCSSLDLQRDTFLCEGCRDWFPRPPIRLQFRYPERRDRMLAFFADALEGRWPPRPAWPEPGPTLRPLPWWQRLWRARPRWRRPRATSHRPHDVEARRP